MIEKQSTAIALLFVCERVCSPECYLTPKCVSHTLLKGRFVIMN